MIKHHAIRLFGASTAVLLGTAVFAQMAQVPLIAKSSGVIPNIVYVFDDSGSMSTQAIYQYGGTAGAYGMPGPNNDVTSTPTCTTTSCPYNFFSPDVNLIAYDPRISYSRRLNADGTYQPAGTKQSSSSGTFNVYFYNPATTNIYSVSSVTVASGGSGYPSSDVTAVFNNAPVGGTNAEATVTTSPVSIISSGQVTAGGSGYNAFTTDKSNSTPSNKVTFSAPSSGGITATGYFVTTTAKSVASVVINDVGSGYPTTGSFPVTFTAPATTGVTATGTATIATTKTLTGVNITNRGSGYPISGSGLTVSFTGGTLMKNAIGNVIGVAAQGTVSTATFYPVGGVSLDSGGSGYTSAPTVTVSGGGGSGATVTPTMAYTYSMPASYNVPSGNQGSGYTSTPTATLAAGSGGTCSTITVTRSSGKITKLDFTCTSTFTSAPTINFSGSTTGSAATPFTIPLSSLTKSGGSIVSLAFTGGSQYSSAPTVSFSGGGGSGATATATLSASGTVGISAINITPGTGYGYTTVPTGFTISGGSGGGVAGTTSAGTTNSVTAISVTNGGAGYTNTPTITLPTAAGTPTTVAKFTTSNSGTTNIVNGIVITNPGQGYSGTATCAINVTPGSNATCGVTMGTTYAITSINVTNHGSGYTSTPKLTISSLINPSAACNSASPSPLAQCVVNTDTTVRTGINSQWNGAGTPTGASSYFTTTPAGATKPGYLPDSGSPLAPGATLISYPNIANSTTTQYPKFLNRTDCAADYCSWADELQNWNNWYAYHRTRLDLAKTGIGLAFQPLSGTFRLGWASLNTVGNTGGTLDAGVRPFDTTTRSSFFTWLYGRTANNSTPSRIAVTNVGNYYKRKDDGGPWADTPPVCTNCSSDPATGTANTAHASCRRSYSIFMTDGYYNDSFSQTPSDVDSTAKTVGSYTYPPSGPYSDTKTGTIFSNTFADVAMNFWLQDLRPDLADNLTSKSADLATWQHMNFYAIGLGLVGTLDATDPQTLTSLTGNATRTQDWPNPKPNDQTAIDDMWHATINGHGLMLNARNANQLKDSILQIISDVSGKEDSQAGVALSQPSQSAETFKYTPWYTTGYWIGNVKAWHLDPVTSNEICGPNPTVINTCPAAWEIETKTGTDPITGVPSFTSLIPNYSSRNILVGNGATTGTRAEIFSASMSAGLKGAMGGTVNANLINYLRGDASNETAVGSVSGTTGTYRGRVARLGDVVNSKPNFVYRNTVIDYSLVPGATNFTTYQNSKGARTEGMLFVGANDGMLHGFRNGQYTYSGNTLLGVSVPGGIETFAYIPRAILPKLNQLADIGYSHRYYVDGRITQADTFINPAGTTGLSSRAWANVVLGSTGAGAGVDSSAGSSPGTSVFAIDVTKLNDNSIAWPCTGSSCTLNADSVLWEVGSKLSTDFAELGYMLSDVQAGPTLDGNWVAIFGNGYESKSCKAQLFIVNMANGSLIKKIDTGSGSCSSASTKNGLGGVTLVRNGKQQIIGAYAGDLLGNMWKFNLNDAANSNWNVDFGGSPLFAAGATKPITAPPTVIDLADPNVWTDRVDTAPTVGYMVVFGTGKLFEASDVNTTNQQTLYGVWDDKLMGAAGAVAAGSSYVAASSLVSRSISAPSQLVITDTTKKGWYADFSSTSERQIYPLTLADEKHNIVADPASPVGIATDACTTGTGGKATLQPLDALWITVSPSPPPCQSTNTCTPDPDVPYDPTVPVCIGAGCKPPCTGGVWNCSSPIQGEPALMKTNQKCPNGADLFKLISAEEQTCTTVCHDGQHSITTKSIDICSAYNPPPTPLTGNKTRKWRELFLR
ncbi:MAG: PilC/PilY family type IV pilus protein [Burkholderiales bacterium]